MSLLEAEKSVGKGLKGRGIQSGEMITLTFFHNTKHDHELMTLTQEFVEKVLQTSDPDVCFLRRVSYEIQALVVGAMNDGERTVFGHIQVTVQKELRVLAETNFVDFVDSNWTQKRESKDRDWGKFIVYGCVKKKINK